MTTRRTFLQQAGMISAGLFVRPSFIFDKPAGKIGIQLYTLRDELSKDVRSTIAKVAGIGFKEVETFGYTKKGGYWGLSPKEFLQLLKSNGLTSSSGHYGMDQLLGPENKLDDLKSYIEAASVTGQQYITVPYLDNRLRGGADVYKRHAERLNRAGELCKRSGLQLAYHNHNFEFKAVDGTTGYQILLKETDPSLLKMELDLFWAVKAGQDPVTLFKENPGRFAMWHVKDLDPDTKTFTEVGSGKIDFKSIFAKAGLAGMKHFFLEQDVIKMDPYASISKSYGYIKDNLVGEL